MIYKRKLIGETTNVPIVYASIVLNQLILFAVSSLHDIEEELEGIAREQKMASAEIVSLVNENERVLAQMRVRMMI